MCRNFENRLKVKLYDKIEYSGQKDYYEILQDALDKGGRIEVGSGKFTVSRTLKIHSDTTLVARADTIFYTADNSKKHVMIFY